MSRRVEILMWLGLFGAPVAWAASHVVGWGVSEANCGVVGRQWGISYSTWVVVLGVLAATLAIVGIVGSVLAYREVKGTDKDAGPPAGRIWILSISGMVLGPLLLMIILLTGSGALILSQCHQG